MILYHIIALRPPMELRDLDYVLRTIRSGAWRSLEQRVLEPEENGAPAPALRHCPGEKLPEGLVAIVAKAMQHSAKDRYQSVKALQRDIVAFQNGFAPSAEEAGLFRKLQLLLGRRRREAVVAVCFLVLSHVLLAGFFLRMASDRRKLRENESSLAIANGDLYAKNQRLEQIVFQLRSTAERNFENALLQIRQKHVGQALSQINLALVGVSDSTKAQARFLTVRGLVNTQLGFYSEAVTDFRQADAADPGSIPLALMEADLETGMILGGRPPGGWEWEESELRAASNYAASFRKTNLMNAPASFEEKPIKLHP
ncbi:MAG: hypothetical protein WCL08_01255 [Verrucomicrobiota bacterium]